MNYPSVCPDDELQVLPHSYLSHCPDSEPLRSREQLCPPQRAKLSPLSLRAQPQSILFIQTGSATGALILVIFHLALYYDIQRKLARSEAGIRLSWQLAVFSKNNSLS